MLLVRYCRILSVVVIVALFHGNLFSQSASNFPQEGIFKLSGPVKTCKETEFRYIKGKKVKQRRIGENDFLAEFNPDGKIVTQAYFDKKGKPKKEHRYYYNSSGRLQKKTIRWLNGREDYAFSNSIVYKDTVKVMSVVYRYWSAGGKKQTDTFVVKNIFSADGKVTGKVSEGSRLYTMRSTFSYTPQGRKKSEESIYHDSFKDTTNSSFRHFLEYDSAGRIAVSTSLYEDFEGVDTTTTIFRSVYLYNAKNEPVSIEDYNGGKLFQREISERDEFGNKVRVRLYKDTESEPYIEFTHVYTYDKFNNWIKRTTYNHGKLYGEMVREIMYFE